MVARIKKKSGGFTIIEMLVAVAIFSLVAVASSEIFVFSIKGQRKYLASQEILDQASYFMEYASKAIRMAKKDVDGVCIGPKLNYQKTHGGQGIRFKNYQGICQEFYLEGGQLKEDKGGVVSSLTSGNLQVVSFNIGPEDAWDQEDTDQPKVTFFLEIQGKEQAKIKIQTTVSQRNPDIEQ
ncbi:MAG: prepilin-type N-terminal cleavage/methylation domain-containing protein [Candidatus Nealsonbacteria bacterium]|nr:prepilin-type N-terminal cleavage/methylation domain-containing protein [Candidatus Nealsonbacteria bacterium]